MAIQPGSLDHLYYKGILDYIPYDLYDQPLVSKKLHSPMQTNAQSLRQEILSNAGETKKMNKSDKSYIWKGLIGLGVIVATLVCLAKRSSSFWKKLNPKNW